MKKSTYCDVKEAIVSPEENAYRLISLRDNMYINDWLRILFTGYYPDLVSDICFESMEVYLTTFVQREDSLLMKTVYETEEVVFLMVDFPYLAGVMEVDLIHMLFSQIKRIKDDHHLPVIPCVIFQTQHDYDIVLSLLNQLPYETALLINYLSFIYEE